MAMEVALGSQKNDRKVLEMVDIIDSTRLQDRPDAWSDQTFGSIDYHPGPTGRDAD